MANGLGNAPDVGGLLAQAGTIRQEGGVTPEQKQPSKFGKFFSTLNERIANAAEVVSPELREIRQQQRQDIQQQETVRREEERAERQFQQENRQVVLDDALRDTTPSINKFLRDRARRLGIITVNENGQEVVTSGDGLKALQELQDEPEEIIALNNLGIQDHRKQLASSTEAEKKEIDKMMSSAMKENPNASPLETREKIMKASRDPANQSDVLRQINADKEFLNGKIRELRTENVSLQEQEEEEEELPTFTPEIRTRLDDIAEDLRVIDQVEDEVEKRQLQFALLQEAMRLVPAEDQNRVVKFLRPFAPDAFAESLP